MFRRALFLFVTLLTVILRQSPAVAQGQGKAGLKPKPAAPAKSKPGSVRSTMIEIELLTTDGGGLQAQQWRSALESLEIPLSIRRGLEDDKLETKEKVIGTLRKVTVIGKLERSGRLIFADREFDPGDRAKLKEWINDLQTFGAQGKPDGKPLWGLNEEQFTAVYDSLSAATTVNPRGEDLEEAVKSFPMPSQFPVRWTEAAKARLNRSPGKKPVRQNTAGFSLATALAIALKDYGLGFRPSRTPAGDLELAIDVPETATDVWPVGWPLKLPRQKAAPKFFALNQVFFDATPLAELLTQASQAAEIPMILDYGDVEVQGKDWAALVINYPPRQATWHTVVRDSLNKAKLTFDVWQDERGLAFVYVSSLKGKRNAAAEK